METPNPLLFTSESYKPYFSFWRHTGQDLPHFIYRQHPVPGTPPGFSELTFPVEPEALRIVDTYARQRQPGRFALLFATFTFLLHKYSGREDVIIHTPLYTPLAPDVVYAPIVPLRIKVGMQTLKAYLETCKQCLQAHYRFQNFPLQLTAAAGTEVPAYHSNVLMRYEGLHNHFNITAAATQYDMIIDTGIRAGTLYCTIHYNTAAFETWWMPSVEQHAHSFLSCLPDAGILLSGINILGPSATKALARFNDTTQPFPDQSTMHALFQQQVAQTPDQIAVIYNEKTLTYRQLNEAANQLAHFLADHCHILPGDILGVCLPRSEWQVICMLAILKSGAVYLPIDITLPENRIHFILHNAGARLLLTNEASPPLANSASSIVKLKEQTLRQIAACPGENPVEKVQAQSPAYVIYTSGSTGTPKGVMIAHRSNVNMSLDQIRKFDIRQDDRILQFASISFDAAISEYFMAFYCGATLVLADNRILWDTHQFITYIKKQGVTVATLPPSYLGILPPGQLCFLRVLITAGEAANPDQAIFFSKVLHYYNAYGPTEYAVCASIYKMPAAEDNVSRVPIGAPIANTQLFVLDNNKLPLPMGVTGRLYVSGEGLAIGYLGADELTREKFIPHWRDPGKKMYDTGDLARWLPDGNLLFIGRSDDQVKINGFRIEPGEIKHTLLQFPGIAECVVLPVEKNGEWRLVAFYRCIEQNQAAMHRPDEPSILEYLRSRLPPYMIPASVTEVQRYPVNTNGKIDKSKLLELLEPGKAHVAPRNAMEEKMKRLWESILGVENIGIHDNFFKLGGSSIDIISLYNHISAEYPQVDVRIIFKHPTIGSFVEAVNELL